MDKRAIKNGMSIIAQLDDDVALAVEQFGLPDPRIRPAGFETFLSTVVSQQISTAAANAIMSRVRALLPSMRAEDLLDLADERLREAGLSFRKIEYAKGMAQAIVAGQFDAQALAKMDDAQAIESITALRGFGRWSAEIYLMFSLQRQDVFPADDLALLVALGRLKGLDKKPTPKQAQNLVEAWSPWRSVGAIFLWHYYRQSPQ